MASVEHEPITGSGGGAPSGVQGTAPGQGIRDLTSKGRGKLASCACFK